MRTVPVKGWRSNQGERGTKRRVSHKPRTAALLKDLGLLVHDCERRDPWKSVKRADGTWDRIPGGQTKDLFGCADLLALPASGFTVSPLLIQICSVGTVSSHRRKAEGELVTSFGQKTDLVHLLWSGFRFWIVAWEKPASRWRAWIHEAKVGEASPVLPVRVWWEKKAEFYQCRRGTYRAVDPFDGKPLGDA